VRVNTEVLIGCGAANRQKCWRRVETVTEARLAPPRGKQGDKPDENGGLKENVSHLLELLNSTLIDTTALVDQVTCISL
jgi:hypothetical protein